ncbi:Arylsulfatase A [Fodinibius roseus]|uniref:Arylsulfatase A n=1 Tax=Fodinibius roseus TaxID=1194090 RepID=A0A1M5KV89_9BACT|nr:arylsulfatase [Fodinibius roseus]SHG56724.1 Arylsulfatase A [Fodinibius roseus]
MFIHDVQGQDKPNIVVILADDLGYGDVSFYNENAAFKTPNIDRLGDAGVAFTNAHTTSAVCTPTRYGLLTGRYNWRSTLKSGVTWGYSGPLIPNERMTVADMLQARNYETAFIGKWHLGWDWHFAGEGPEDLDNPNIRPEVDFSQPIENGPNTRGFGYSYAIPASLDMPPYVYVENNQPTTIPADTTVNYDQKGFWRKGLTGSDFSHADVLPHLTNKTIKYINEQASNSDPFFVYFALPAPHTPILPTSEYLGKSNSNLYGDFVLQVDGMVGKVMEALEANGLFDDTILIFTSDNGASPRADFEELQQAGHDPSYIYRGHKADIYEAGLRVPFLVSWPDGIEGSFASNETISTADFMATFADLTGTNLPDNAAEDSYSFLPVLKQLAYGKPLREATVLHSIDGRFAIMKEEWKLILWPGSGGWSYPNTEEDLRGLPSFQLYNLEKDPAEKFNLVHIYPDKVKELKSLLEIYIDEGRSTPGIPQTNEGPERWEQLDWMEL